MTGSASSLTVKAEMDCHPIDPSSRTRTVIANTIAEIPKNRNRASARYRLARRASTASRMVGASVILFPVFLNHAQRDHIESQREHEEDQAEREGRQGLG